MGGSDKYPQVSYDKAGSYDVQLAISSFCGEDSVSKTVTIEPDCAPELHIPNVFTPNGDGENDLFVIPYKHIAEINIAIYNRWGELIYEINDLDTFWDGNNKNGRLCSDGVYYYIIKGKATNKQQFDETGYVQLLDGK